MRSIGFARDAVGRTEEVPAVWQSLEYEEKQKDRLLRSDSTLLGLLVLSVKPPVSPNDSGIHHMLCYFGCIIKVAAQAVIVSDLA